MQKLIGVVDLSNGIVTSRYADSLTLDIPPDLDRVTGGVSLNADQIGRYSTVSGENRSYRAHPRVLSGRARGEECLVAATEIDSRGDTCKRRYRISMVDLVDLVD